MCRKQTPSCCRNCSHTSFQCSNAIEILSYAFLTATYLINRMPMRSLSSDSPWQKLFITHQTTLVCASLGVLVMLTCVPILSTSWKLAQNSVLCSVIVSITGAIHVLMSLQVVFICLDMFLMNHHFLSSLFILNLKLLPFLHSPLCILFPFKYGLILVLGLPFVALCS